MTATRRLFLALALASNAFVLHSVADAQDLGDVRVAVNVSEVKLGERFSMTVEVTHSQDTLVNVAPPERSAQLLLVEVRPRTDTPVGGGMLTRFEYIMAIFSTGDVQLQPLRISWLRADGATGAVLATPPVVAVRAMSQPNDTSLRPLKPQLDVAGAPPAWQRPALATLSMALLVVIVGTAVRQLRRRRTVMPITLLDEELTPETEARRRLDVLAVDDPLARGDYDAYYGTIATVVRDYLEERFAFGARALTTTELQQRMVSRGVERWQARLVGGLLDRCDGAVYAGRHPDPASADHDLTVAFEIVELSRPGSVVAAS